MDEDMNTPNLPATAEEDAQLWRDLATMWESLDPMPPELVERVLVALATDDLDGEYELLHLVERSERLAGARGASEALTISFSGASFSLLLRVSGLGTAFRRVDGWVTPAHRMRVTVRQQDRTWQADVDESGRFELPRVPGGLSRFWLFGRQAAASNEEQELFATPAFEL